MVFSFVCLCTFTGVVKHYKTVEAVMVVTVTIVNSNIVCVDEACTQRTPT